MNEQNFKSVIYGCLFHCLGNKADDSQHKTKRYWNNHHWLSRGGCKDVSQF